jgi:hypothetical protein
MEFRKPIEVPGEKQRRNDGYDDGEDEEKFLISCSEDVIDRVIGSIKNLAYCVHQLNPRPEVDTPATLRNAQWPTA